MWFKSTHYSQEERICEQISLLIPKWLNLPSQVNIYGREDAVIRLGWTCESRRIHAPTDEWKDLHIESVTAIVIILYPIPRFEGRDPPATTGHWTGSVYGFPLLTSLSYRRVKASVNKQLLTISTEERTLLTHQLHPSSRRVYLHFPPLSLSSIFQGLAVQPH